MTFIKQLLSNEKKHLTNYYYWLRILMIILSGLLTMSISVYLYGAFVLAIIWFIKYEYPEDLPFKENDRIILHEKTDIHDYYFIRYADVNQKEAYITLFPGSEQSFEKLVDVKSFYKEY